MSVDAHADDVVRLDGATALGRDVLGGKAWAINQLAALGLPTPPAFTLTIDVCRAFHDAGGEFPAGARAALAEGMAWLEHVTGRSLGGTKPLVVSVRSGAESSMPGMMDTILNVGITPATEKRLANELGSSVAADLEARFHEQFERVVGRAAPADAEQQLIEATAAVFRSWNSDRARAYRNYHGLGHDGGTAVTVQAMVFGNRDNASGTGVLFTRNPLRGSPEPYGEWLAGAQGDDIVSGRATPAALDTLAKKLPDVHADLLAAARRVETAQRDIQDIEFTVEAGRLWILQTRAAKRSAEAAVRLAIAFCREGLIDRPEALRRISPEDVSVLLRPRLDPAAPMLAHPLARGEPASPGCGAGVVVTTADEAESVAAQGIDPVLARPTTDPDDVHGMIVAAAVITEIGGSTSHAAVVSRELGKPCVVGCGQGTLTPLAGRRVTVDGGGGYVYEGAIPVIPPSPDDPDLDVLAGWLGCDDVSALPAALRDQAEGC